MQVQKISISLQQLQQAYLEFCYLEANQEIDNAFEISVLDGIEESDRWRR